MAYALWESGEPNNMGGHEDCIETNWSKRGEWNDIACTALLPYVCEKKGQVPIMLCKNSQMQA